MSILFSGAAIESEGYEPEGKVFGERYRERYHLPLLPGEEGTKAGGDWVPGGVMSATNLAGAIVDSRALSIWEIERTQIGLALRPDLYERLSFMVNRANAAGVQWSELRASPAGRELIPALAEIHKGAKTASGADIATIQGTNRHDAWEERARSGLLFGTPAINAEIEALERLLAEHGLERVPGLSERTVRNVGLNAAGRFDDVLLSRKTGRLYLADLKTKRKAFYSWLETWIQLSVYATAEWMLDFTSEWEPYIPGPAHHVDQERAVLLRMPSDGAPPFLEKVDLVAGRRWAELARAVVDARSESRSVKTHSGTAWSED